MELSVVIVNYNVKPFLEQCLRSVEKAIEKIEGEIFVVDNNSADGSCSMVSSLFPAVNLIRNDYNAGFSAANNMAIRKARGRYILLLNPDTLIGEDSLQRCVSFLDSEPGAGALGVRMINGKGKFLPESRRNFPSPMAAFYKIAGLSRVFPRSSVFNRYHSPGGDTRVISKVEILSGAFMMIRKSILDRIGLLDEDFFMYGEDIDLSHRITSAGLDNYYLPDVTIVHYKGESMRRGNFNWVILFYKAMLIFSRKYFRKKRGFWFTLMIRLSIIVRAGLSLLKELFFKLIPLFTDAVLLYGTMRYIIVPLWESVKLGHGNHYPAELISILLPLFCIAWIGIWSIFRVYRIPFKPVRVLRSLIPGLLITLAIYGLLPLEMRFSRLLIVAGTVVAGIVAMTNRSLATLLSRNRSEFGFLAKKRVVIVGAETDYELVSQGLEASGRSYKVLGRISTEQDDLGINVLGTTIQISEIVRINRPDEIIFCTGKLGISSVITIMKKLEGTDITYRLSSEGSSYIVGSDHSDKMGESFYLSGNIPDRKVSISARIKRWFF